MITLLKMGGGYNRNTLEIVGLSTDAKPTGVLEGRKVSNGDLFYEMDTKKFYMFDEAGTAWLPVN